MGKVLLTFSHSSLAKIIPLHQEFIAYGLYFTAEIHVHETQEAQALYHNTLNVTLSYK